MAPFGTRALGFASLLTACATTAPPAVVPPACPPAAPQQTVEPTPGPQPLPGDPTPAAATTPATSPPATSPPADTPPVTTPLVTTPDGDATKLPLPDEPPRPVCVVLSVGAEQGLSHIGVINALRERGVVVDCVIGTSMGALIGGLYASAPKEDLGRRYAEVFSFYSGKKSETFSAKASDLWFAASSALGTAQGWERMRDALGLYLGQARVESLPIPFVTVHQRLTETGARSETVRGGRLSDEVAASIANPLIFPGMTIQRGTQLDPGLDRVSAVALETACEQFPKHQFVVSNVTPHEVFVSARMQCPYQELVIPGVGVDRRRAFMAEDPDFTRLVRAGYEKALRSLDFSRLPVREKPTSPPLEFVRVTLDIELSPQGPDGKAWDGLDGLPDIRQTTRIVACPGCEPRATHAGQSRTSEGNDSLRLHADLGVLGLRRGFTLRVELLEVDVRSDDALGTVDLAYQRGEGEPLPREVQKKLPLGTVKVRFAPP